MRISINGQKGLVCWSPAKRPPDMVIALAQIRAAARPAGDGLPRRLLRQLLQAMVQFLLRRQLRLHLCDVHLYV